MKEPFRVGVLLNSLQQPAWVRRLLREVRDLPCASIVLLVKLEQSGPQDLFSGDARGPWLYRLYRRYDDARFRARPSAFEVAQIDGLTETCSIVSAFLRNTGAGLHFGDEDLAAIRARGLDVAIDLSSGNLCGNASKIAKYGTWRLRHGDPLVTRTGPEGLWEILHEIPITGSYIDIVGELPYLGRTLLRSYAATDLASLAASRNNYYWKASSFVARKLKELREKGEVALRVRSTKEATPAPYGHRAEGAPSNATMLKFLVRTGVRSVVRRIDRRFFFDQWILLYKLHERAAWPADVGSGLRKILPPKDRFWADPFPVQQDGRYYVFLEEYRYAEGKGVISILELDDQGRWSQPTAILETEHHLSYPFVFEWQGSFYMVPESAESRRVTLYRCRSFPYEWEPEADILSDIRAVDSTLHVVEGRWWLFANVAVEGARFDDELHLFFAERPTGPWTPHPQNPVKSDARSARPAGRLFEYQGELYRPAQDCSRIPGYAISLNRIERLTTTEFVECEETKIVPDWEKRIVSTHTINQVGGLTIVDGRYRRRR